MKHIANKNIRLRVPFSHLLLFLNVIKPICWMCYAYMHLSPSPQKQCIFTRAVVVRTTTCLPERKFTVQSGSHESLLPSNKKQGDAGELGIIVYGHQMNRRLLMKPLPFQKG